MFDYICSAPQKIKVSEFWKGTEYFSDNILASFFQTIFFSKKENHKTIQKKENKSTTQKSKIIIQLLHTGTAILSYLILIVIVYFVKSLNRYESLLINQENSNFVT